MTTELAPLPAGWAWAAVEEIGEVRLGRQRAPEHHSGPNMRPYLRVANVFEDRIDTSDILSMNFEPREYDIYRLELNDVLLNEGQSLHLVGRPALYRGEVPGACFQNTLVRFRARPEVLPKFALSVFRFYLHSGRFQRIAKWTTNIAHLGAERFAALEFPLAPPREQSRIVDALDSYLSRLDAAVASLEAAQAKLKAYRASVLKAAVEGRLVPTEASLASAEKRDYEPADVLLKRILTERRRRWEEAELAKLKASGKSPKDDKWKAKYEEPKPPDTKGLPELPEGWCWASVGALAEVSGGLTKNAARDQLPRRLPYLRVANVYANELNLDEIKEIGVTDDELPRVALQPGDLLVVEGNGSVDQIGRVALWDGAVSQMVHQNHLIKARFGHRPLERWALTWLLSPGGRRAIVEVASSTSGLHTLSISKVENLPIPLPPLAEQTQILDDVDAASSIVAATGSAIDGDRKRCIRLRQSVLKWAFEGKLVDQDPNDEPADQLLARIRAERATTPTPKKARRARGRS